MTIHQTLQRFLPLIIILGVLVVVAGCMAPQASKPERFPHENGTYRGVFIDRDMIQVNVEFTLADGTVTGAEFRRLYRNEDYHLNNDQEPYRSVIQQYQEALDHLVGKDLARHLLDLYAPGDIVSTQVDGYSGATIRSNKLISAIRDGLNRGPYSY